MSTRRFPRALVLATLVLSCAASRTATDAGATAGEAPVTDPSALRAVPPSRFCTTQGRVEPLGGNRMKVDVAAMRGFVAGDASRTGELSFVYRRASAQPVPLADGELRRQVGLKLRARDTCNVIYVMWYEGGGTIHASIKHNAGMTTHAQCGDQGYIGVTPSIVKPIPPLRMGEPHVLNAELEGASLSVMVDSALVWAGDVPSDALDFDGPAGVRSDNVELDFELRVPATSDAAQRATCP